MKKKQAVEEIERQIEMLRSSVEEHRSTAAKLVKEITEQEEKTSKWYDVVRTTNEVRQYNGYEWYNKYNDARWNYSMNGWNKGWQHREAADEAEG